MLETDPNSAWAGDPLIIDPLTIRAVGPDFCREEILSISLTIQNPEASGTAKCSKSTPNEARRHFINDGARFSLKV